MMNKEEIKLAKRYVNLIFKQEDQELFDELFAKGMFRDDMCEDGYNLVMKALNRLEVLEQSESTRYFLEKVAETFNKEVCFQHIVKAICCCNDKEQQDNAIASLSILKRKLVIYDNALNKACEYISEIMGSCPYYVHDFQSSRCAECQNECNVCWKEWCMKNAD